MKVCRFRFSISILIMFFLISAANPGLGARGSATAAESAQAAPEPIEIEADRLTIENTSRRAEFSGNVKAVQGNARISSQRLLIHYKSSGDQQGPGQTENIEKIEALGKVEIIMDNKVAVTDQAVYTTSDRKLVLSGPGSTLTVDGNVITGEKITLDRDKGDVQISGGPGRQVRALIHSEQRGLN